MLFFKKIIPAAILTATLCSWAGNATALSCMPHDLSDTYKSAAESKDRFVIVHGILRFDEKLLPETDMQNQQDIPQETRIPARLTGHSLSKEGFVTDFDQPITLSVRCSGPWCAGAKSEIPYLAFLQDTGQGYDLVVTACGGYGFGAPQPQALQTIISCYRNTTCK